ncbi:MAG: FAD-binding protein [Candidatus Lokiarchaeota archaeon]|nr:FAD-binding protein [Candidatus Lokiarchaeota archaeon]MBD3200247.1 FAD-binding protein [Candidatus Lokiarchaeota archaeon]
MNLKDLKLIYQENRKEIKNRDEIVKELRDILGEKCVSTNNIDILAYTRDSSLISLNWTIEGKIAGLPEIITWPKDEEAIIKVLEIANREKIPIVPFAEGSGVVGGAIPIQGGIILDLKNLDEIIEINEKNLTVTTQTGVNGMNLERYLNAKGYTCGHIPQSLYTSSVGGWIAHKAAGQFSTKYGKIEDIVLGMRIILPEGDKITFEPIARAATGPQLDKYFIGGEGTLGIVTKATLKIWPYPEKRNLISYAFPTMKDSLEAVRETLRENVYPAVVRIYDADETARHFEHVEKAKDKVMTVFVCEGNQKLVDLEDEITRKMCLKNSGIDCGEDPVEHWFETRFKVTETSMFPPYRIVADTIEVSVMWDNAVDLYHNVVETVKQVKGNLLITAHVSHFYPNGVGFYFTFGGVPGKGMTEFDFYKSCWNATIKAVIHSGGSIAHHHGIGINRSHFMEEEWNKGYDVMKKFKNVLDPNNILNPGKIYEKTWKNQGGNE